MIKTDRISNVADMKEYIYKKLGDKTPDFLETSFAMLEAGFPYTLESLNEGLARAAEKLENEINVGLFISEILVPYTLWGSASLAVGLSTLNIFLEKELVTETQLQKMKRLLDEAHHST